MQHEKSDLKCFLIGEERQMAHISNTTTLEPNELGMLW